MASSLSAFADSAYFIVLAWTVVAVTHSELALGTTLLLASLPRLALMLLGGVAADRFSPKLLLVLSLAVRAGILALLGTFLAAGFKARTVDFYVLALLFGTVDAFYWPTQGALVPRLISASHLSVANSLIQTAQQTAFVAGPLVAGLLLRLRDHEAFLCVAALYLLGVGAVLRLRAGRPTGDPAQPAASPLTDLVQGLRYVFSIRVMTLIMGISMLMNLLLLGPLNVGLPLFVNHHGWSGSVYGYLEASFGVGAVVGGLLNVLLKGMRGRFIWIGAIGAVTGLSFATVSLIHFWEMGILAMAVAGMTMSLVSIPVMTYIQMIAEAALLGRVMSLLTLMSVGLAPVSYALCSWLLSARLLTPDRLILAAGFLLALLFLSMFFIPEYRTMEDHPRWRLGQSTTSSS